jgi:hypothetical protein
VGEWASEEEEKKEGIKILGFGVMFLIAQPSMQAGGFVLHADSRGKT